MMHKLRDVMGKRDSKYTLLGSVEVDEGFFSTEIPDKQKNEALKRGVGSQAKTKVLVMAESTEVDSPTMGLKPKKVGHIKMVVKVINTAQTKIKFNTPTCRIMLFAAFYLQISFK